MAATTSVEGTRRAKSMTRRALGPRPVLLGSSRRSGDRCLIDARQPGGCAPQKAVIMRVLGADPINAAYPHLIENPSTRPGMSCAVDDFQ